MRRVDKAEDFAAALALLPARGQASFGDDHVLVERYVTRPRHIEIQVFGDTTAVRVPPVRARLLGAAPPPEGAGERPRRGMSAARAAEMGATRWRRQAVGYGGAGTVEFIAEGWTTATCASIWR